MKRSSLYIFSCPPNCYFDLDSMKDQFLKNEAAVYKSRYLSLDSKIDSSLNETLFRSFLKQICYVANKIGLKGRCSVGRLTFRPCIDRGTCLALIFPDESFEWILLLALNFFWPPGIMGSGKQNSMSPGRVTRLECCPIHQKVAGSVLIELRGRGNQCFSLTSRFLSLFLFFFR